MNILLAGASQCAEQDRRGIRRSSVDSKDDRINIQCILKRINRKPRIDGRKSMARVGSTMRLQTIAKEISYNSSAEEINESFVNGINLRTLA